MLEEREKGAQQTPQSSEGRITPLLLACIPFFLTFCVLFCVWLLLSGRLDRFHLILGGIASAMVAAYSGDLLFPAPRIKRFPGLWLRFAAYIPWLLFEVLRANLHLLYLVFHPRMHKLIDPHIIGFDSRLTSDLARTLFANSITLTPGTITVYVSIYGKFTVHVIDQPSGESLPGEMETRIAHIFGE